jgi:hypothetical protein
MGLIAKSQTKKLVAEQAMPWNALQDIPDWMTPPELLYLSAVQMLAVARKNSGESFVRVELGGDGFMLDSSSWAMRATMKQDANVTVEMARYQTRDDELQDKKAIVRAREWLAGSLAKGPDLRISDGLPDFSTLIEPTVMATLFGKSGSDLEGDSLPPMPECFHDGTQLEFPAHAAAGLAAAMNACCGATAPNADELAAIEVGLWSEENRARLSLRVADDEARMSISCPVLDELSPIGAGRLLRSTMRTMLELSDAMEAEPQSQAIIDAFRDACAAPSKAPDRVSNLLPLWSGKVSAPTMSFKDGMVLPIGVLVTSSKPLTMEQVVDAERALLVRHRAENPGFTRKALVANPKYLTRRPAVLASADGDVMPYLRYIQAGESETDTLWLTDGKGKWYWEVALVSCDADEQGRNRVLMLADGLSIISGCFAYGTELLALYRSWVATVRASDPEAEVKTVSVRLPRVS